MRRILLNPTSKFLRSSSTALEPAFKDILKEEKPRDKLRVRFFELAKKNHPSITGDVKAYQKIVDEYEEAIKVVDKANPIESWDGISAMTYAQAWEGKDVWRKKWESHWAWRLAHMYKHHEEMEEINDKMKLRESQYIQVKDWAMLAGPLLNGEEKEKWEKSLELWKGNNLWLRTNKSNYRRYYISNTNEPAHMLQVYKEHDFWKNFEETQWQEWESFFNQAKDWVDKNESQIRARQNLEGPLITRYEYLMHERHEFAQLTDQQKLEIRSKEEGSWNKLFWRRERGRWYRLAVRWLERILRGTAPLFFLTVVAMWLMDYKVEIHMLEYLPGSNGSWEAHPIKKDIVQWIKDFPKHPYIPK